MLQLLIYLYSRDYLLVEEALQVAVVYCLINALL